MKTEKTIKVSQETREKLLAIKIHHRETFDDIINRILEERK